MRFISTGFFVALTIFITGTKIHVNQSQLNRLRIVVPDTQPNCYESISEQISGYYCQDENSEDVFDMPMISREVNEGMETFETSTEMIDLNETALNVKPLIGKNVFTPITPLDTSVGVFNVSNNDFGEEPKEEEEDESGEMPENLNITSSTDSDAEMEVITFSSIPIVADEVADRRVLKEKEIPMRSSSIPPTTSTPIETFSDPSETSDENEAPFDQSALEGLFEQDGSVIDTSLTTDQSPPFPILKMAEEEPKIIANIITTTEKAIPTESRTEETTRMTETTEIVSTTTSHEDQTGFSEEVMEISTNPTFLNSSKVFLPAKAIRTPISFRIISLQFIEEFEDLNSGPSKKLSKAIVPSIIEYVELLSGAENVVNVEMVSFTKGSVIVAANLVTKKSLGDSQMAVNLLEAAISRNNSMISEYSIDSLSVTLDNITSQAYIDSISTQNVSSSSISPLVTVIICISILTIISAAFLIIYMSTRNRRNSTMKMSLEDTIRSITPESAESQRSVHLMSYGKAQRLSQKIPTLSKSKIDETNGALY